MRKVNTQQDDGMYFLVISLLQLALGFFLFFLSKNVNYPIRLC